MKFYIKFEISASETFNMLKTAYGDVAMNRVTCFKWREHFRDSRQSIEDDERPGRIFTSTDDSHVDKILHEYLPRSFTVNQT